MKLSNNKLQHIAPPLNSLIRKRNHFRDFSSYGHSLSEKQLTRLISDATEVTDEIKHVVSEARQGNFELLSSYLENMPQEILISLFEKELI